MNGRRIAVLAVVVVAAAAVVGLSAAATRGDSPKPAKASKTAKPAKQSVSQGDVVSTPTSQQTLDEVASYWTKERMHNAKPMEKTVPGASQSPSPAPSVKGVPAGTSTSAPAKQTQGKRSRSQADGVTSSPDAGPNAADYWTQDKMDSAQPMGPTVPGGNGGSQGSPGAPIVGGGSAGTP